MLHTRNLKQALIHGLVLKNVHGLTKFSQNVWLKLNIDINTDLRKKAKNDFFFQLMNNVVLEKEWKMCETIEI